jgi:Flp pilus assembly protein TadG
MIMPESSVTDKKDLGQAIVLIAMGFVILLGFAGLAIDVGRVFYTRGQLRRAVDAGGLAASGQFRLNATTAKINDAAKQLILAHGFVSAGGASPSLLTTAITSIVVDTCVDPNANHSGLYCENIPRRKLVRVKATATVPMIFMQLLGFPTVELTADSMAEAAAVDALLVLDASESQAYDPPSGNAYCAAHPGTCINVDGTGNYGCRADYLGGTTNVNACIQTCNASNSCHPFKEVKDAAKAFVGKMYQDYDRIGIVQFNRNATVVHPLNTTLGDPSNPPGVSGEALYDIEHMTIPDDAGTGIHGTSCPFSGTDNDWICATSNLGGGILVGSQQFATNKRQGSLWTMIVLGSGGADATDPIPGSSDPETVSYGFCPPRYDSEYQPPILPSGQPSKSEPAPLCRSRRFSSAFDSDHLPITSTGMITVQYPVKFDAKDYAVMWGNYIGSAANADGTGGMGVLVFTIGLGKKVVCTAGTYNSSTGSCTSPWDLNYVDPDTGRPNGAESLLRYLAVTGNGSYPPVDNCAGVPSGQQCDNYYFAPNSAGLNNIFLIIAGRIFTRITN